MYLHQSLVLARNKRLRNVQIYLKQNKNAIKNQGQLIRAILIHPPAVMSFSITRHRFCLVSLKLKGKCKSFSYRLQVIARIRLD